MGQLFDDLLRSRELELRTNAVDMNALAGEACDSLALEAQGRDIA